MKFSELIASPREIMGAKAVFGPIGSHILCFGSRGDPGSSAYHSKPRAAAQRAVDQPWVICIGGGSRVRDNLGGKVLNVVRVGYEYGDTASFVEREEAQRLAQWPVAVVLNDVWAVDGFPHVIEDLGMPDRRVLENAMDGIIRHDTRIVELCSRLANWRLTPVAAKLPVNFRPSVRPTISVRSQGRPIPTLESEEGKELWKLQRQKETSPALKKEAKRQNFERHGGIYACEACRFASVDSALFDAHHPLPLAVGVRTTLAEHLVVLCPTCHRKAHRNGSNPLDPHSIEELIRWNAAGRPDNNW